MEHTNEDIGKVNNVQELKSFYDEIYQDLTKDFEQEEKERLSVLKEKIESSDNIEDKHNYYKLLDDSVLQKYATEKQSEMTDDRKAYWRRIDNMYKDYIEKFPLDHYLAQKKGEEIMSIDYNMDPIKFGELRELNDWGKEVWKNIQYLGLSYDELTEHDKESLQEFLKVKSQEEVQDKISELLKELGM